ncbi:MAG: Serine phosphatase RsbU, regulator of sigma subunit [Acidobacteria bacterium]|nr:Serine phosphatase RsbU, regulator of sigma subunit [Acidobacteriota bacterium]
MMKTSMKRYAPFAVCLLGLVVLILLLPRYRVAQPAAVSITRGQALEAADVQARKLGIPTHKAWTATVWMGSPLLEDELKGDAARLQRARQDPAIGPRLGGYRVTYYRRGLEKFYPYGVVYVTGNGDILAARMRKRTESVGAKTTEAQLRPRADAFVASRTFPGAPSPRFESARPSVLTKRIDWVFRYRVTATSPIGNIVPYLNVYYVGDQFAGWELIEEYADGRQYTGDNTGQFVGSLARFGTMFLVLLGLLFIFLKKYHAGEVGVGTSTLLFILALVLLLSFDVLIGASAAEGTGMGSLDAQATMFGMMAFKLLLADLPLAILIFFGWSVGESYARERWGERLASFDALLRRDPFNATVGRSVLIGLLCAPAVAATAFLIGLIPLSTGLAHPALGPGSELVLYLAGPLSLLVASATDALLYSVVAILFVLAFAHRRRALWIGAVVVLLLGALGGLCEVPIDPSLPRFLFGFGGTLACIAIFLAFDLLSTAVAIFAGSLITLSLPLLASTSGLMRHELLPTMAGPMILLAGFAVAALLTRREVVYTYEDLAPHVKRIVERERVKAEIDAANRIQAALLPLDTPSLAGTSVASHYRAATEIGGDYFDFLTQPSGEIGIAFGDVSGHGLTSGIVMAMAKAALLVQVNYDASPRAVLAVLNDIVMKTAPKRMLMTFFFGLLDPAAQTLRFSSAGHLDPYVYRAATRKLEALSSWGFPLGVKRRDTYREHLVEFESGDRLILYSDGLIEALDDDGEPFGFERFEKTLLDHGHGSAEEIKKALLTAVRKFTRNRPPEDDQTLVVVGFEEVTVDRLPVPKQAIVATAVSEAVN